MEAHLQVRDLPSTSPYLGLRGALCSVKEGEAPQLGTVNDTG